MGKAARPKGWGLGLGFGATPQGFGDFRAFCFRGEGGGRRWEEGKRDSEKGDVRFRVQGMGQRTLNYGALGFRDLNRITRFPLVSCGIVWGTFRVSIAVL